MIYDALGMIMHVSLFFTFIGCNQWIYSSSHSNAISPSQAHNTHISPLTQYTLPKRALFRYICGISKLAPLWFASSHMSNNIAIYEQDLGLYFNNLRNYRSRSVTFFIPVTL